MAKKNQTEVAIQPELPFETNEAEAPAAKAKRLNKVAVGDAAQILADAKKLPKTEKALASAQEKLAKAGESVESFKKQVSDLKNLTKANYKNGYVDGYNKGYAAGIADAKKSIIATIKGA